MAITPLPTPPSRKQSQSAFTASAEAFLASIPDFATEANALGVEVEGLRDATSTLKTETQAIKDAAVSETNAIKSSALSDVTALKNTTSGYKDEAQAAATQAQGYRDTASTHATNAHGYMTSAQSAAAAAASGAGLPALTGNAHKVLRVRQDEVGVEFGVGIAQGRQVFTASGTWTKPAEATWVYVEAVGAGGGGANQTSTTAGIGGGGGECVQHLLRASDVSASVTVTVGAGGAGVANGVSGATGGTGGTSSFGAYVVAGGGQGNLSGAGNNSVSNLNKWPFGAPVHSSSTNGNTVFGGGGGATSNITGYGASDFHGDGGAGSAVAGVRASDGSSPGGGGGGSSNDGGGGDGGDGQVTVWWW